jgi:hypothetical protein
MQHPRQRHREFVVESGREIESRHDSTDDDELLGLDVEDLHAAGRCG